MTRRLLLAGLLTLPMVPLAGAADQTVLGKVLLVKNPSTPDKRTISVSAKETATDNTIVGDPVVGGATVTVTANGTSTSSQTFVLPAGTSPLTGKAFWTGDAVKGFAYKDTKGENGPVKNAKLEIRNGIAEIKVAIGARYGAVSVVPPNTGTDGCVLFTVGGGDSYSVQFASGQMKNSGGVLFKVTKPTSQGSCVPTTTTTTTSTTTTTQCSTPAQCPGGSQCQQATCVMGTCGLGNVPAGTPVAVQTPGDCQEVVCDGQGAATSVDDDADVPADTFCSSGGVCTSGVPGFTDFAPPMSRCGPGGDPSLVCDGGGTCVECLTAGDCAGGEACVANQCQACIDDGECGGGGTCTTGVCSPLRYRDVIFPGVTTTSNVAYGSNLSFQGQPVTLFLDVVEPTGDTSTSRPAIVWVHGGSFRTGDKTSIELVDQMNELGRRGFFNVSINYRMTPNGCTVITAECFTAIEFAMHDAQAAVRWLRANAATYGLDANRIAIGGSSAGAITALNVGYNPEDPGDSGNPGFSSAVGAAVSISGARLWGAPNPGEAAALLFHNTIDPLVPYAWATSTVNLARSVGLTALLTTWVGTGHVPYLAHRPEILDQTRTFLYWHLDLANAAQ
jgi:acetyl esterase/lipase